LSRPGCTRDGSKFGEKALAMTEIPKPKRGRKIDLERLRCLRHGDLIRLYRHRWGALLPVDPILLFIEWNGCLLCWLLINSSDGGA
jgi:hypothetical protein